MTTLPARKRTLFFSQQRLPILLTMITMAFGVLHSDPCAAQLSGHSQESGVPGDGILDAYYFPSDGHILTSQGMITRPAGTLTVDTDGSDMIAILIGGQDVSAEPLCDLCNNGAIFDPNAIGFPLSSWVVGYVNESSQWIRISPLDAQGFDGVLGETFVPNPDPNNSYPAFGLADYGAGLGEDDFPKVFADGDGRNWNVVYAGNNNGTWYTNVTVVPEPAALLQLMFCLAIASRRWRRPGLSR